MSFKPQTPRKELFLDNNEKEDSEKVHEELECLTPWVSLWFEEVIPEKSTSSLEDSGCSERKSSVKQNFIWMFRKDLKSRFDNFLLNIQAESTKLTDDEKVTLLQEFFKEFYLNASEIAITKDLYENIKSFVFNQLDKRFRKEIYRIKKNNKVRYAVRLYQTAYMKFST